MATPAARAVKSAFPDCQVAWAVEGRFSELVDGNPYIDHVLACGQGGGRPSLREFCELAIAVRRQRYDAVIDLHGIARSALLAISSGAPRRLGRAHAREFARLAYNEPVVCEHLPCGMAMHFAVLKSLSSEVCFRHSDMLVPVRDEDRRFAEEFVRTEIGDDAPFAVLLPATTRPNKHWVAQYWSELADLVQSRLGLRPLLLGSARDRELMDSILSSVRGRGISAAGRTTLLQAAALIERSPLAIGVDNGLMNIAVALQRPTVAIFGPTQTWRNHQHAPLFIPVYEPMNCSPCQRRPTCRGFDCMAAVRPDRVLVAAEDALSRPGVLV